MQGQRNPPGAASQTPTNVAIQRTDSRTKGIDKVPEPISATQGQQKPGETSQTTTNVPLRRTSSRLKSIPKVPESTSAMQGPQTATGGTPRTLSNVAIQRTNSRTKSLNKIPEATSATQDQQSAPDGAPQTPAGAALRRTSSRTRNTDKVPGPTPVMQGSHSTQIPSNGTIQRTTSRTRSIGKISEATSTMQHQSDARQQIPPGGAPQVPPNATHYNTVPKEHLFTFYVPPVRLYYILIIQWALSTLNSLSKLLHTRSLGRHFPSLLYHLSATSENSRGRDTDRRLTGCPTIARIPT